MLEVPGLRRVGLGESKIGSLELPLGCTCFLHLLLDFVSGNFTIVNLILLFYLLQAGIEIAKLFLNEGETVRPCHFWIAFLFSSSVI